MLKHFRQIRKLSALILAFALSIHLFAIRSPQATAFASRALPQQQTVVPFLYPPSPGFLEGSR